MKEKILIVDDSPGILKALTRKLMEFYDVTTASGPEEGLLLIKSQSPFAVIVSDYMMPGMSGIQFLAKAKESTPDSIRIMLTGQPDLEVAIEAVNKGEIFRFLTKPCLTGILKISIDAGIRYYRLARSEKELIEKTLIGSISVLTDILALSNPEAFGRASRVERMMSSVTGKLRIEPEWEFETAAMLSQIGCVSIPPDIVEKVYSGEELTETEERIYSKHPATGKDLIAHIPRLENVANMILYQNKNNDGTGFPLDGVAGDDIPLGARILHIAIDYDSNMAAGMSSEDALTAISGSPDLYDMDLFETFCSSVRVYDSDEVNLTDLEQGMILADNIITHTGSTIVIKGTKLTRSSMAKLMNIHETKGIIEPIKVLRLTEHKSVIS